MLIIGLGNPGKKYETTPHNAGFLAIETLLKKLAPGETLQDNSKLHAKIASIHHNGEKIILAQPTTFMNESGKSVRAIMDFYKIPVENIIVLHDEADIPLGTFKEAFDRGAAGHNGIRSIIQHLGTKEFKRLRIGVADETEQQNLPLETYVLKPMSETGLEKLHRTIEEIITEII